MKYHIVLTTPQELEQDKNRPVTANATKQEEMLPMILSIDVGNNDELSSISDYSTESDYLITPGIDEFAEMDTTQITILLTDRNQAISMNITTPTEETNYVLNDMVEVRNDETEDWKFGIVRSCKPLMVTVRGSLLRRRYKFIHAAHPSRFPLCAFPEMVADEDSQSIVSSEDDLDMPWPLSVARTPPDPEQVQKRGVEPISSKSSDIGSPPLFNRSPDSSASKRVRWRKSFLPACFTYSCEELATSIDYALTMKGFQSHIVSLIIEQFLYLDLQYLQQKEIRIESNVPCSACNAGRVSENEMGNTGSQESYCYVYLKPDQIVQNTTIMHCKNCETINQNEEMDLYE